MLMLATKKRQFLPVDFHLSHWEDLKNFYDQLLNRTLTSVEVLRRWFSDRSELEGAVSEEATWRYINTTRDVTSVHHRQQYETYVKNILPNIMDLAHQLDEKALQCQYIQALRQETGFDLLIRCMESNIKIYSPKNVLILTQLQLQAQKYGQLVGAMTVIIKGQECTLQQATTHLASQDRTLRKEAYQKINTRYLQDKDALNSLYTSLIQGRHQVALNAGFDNFRDYAFIALRRFDYTPKHCFAFHQGVAEVVVPFLNELAQKRREMLGLAELKPWDWLVDPTGNPPLKPFKHGADLLAKTIIVLDQLDPFLGACLRTMEEMEHLDLESRKNKAPGGYHSLLEESGIPFIFMNAAANFKDMITMLHESGHSVHSFFMYDLPLNAFKHTTSEMGELASMSMELLTMDQWYLLFDDEDTLKRAKKQHLENVIHRLAWIATIDKFQHWVYENYNHTLQQRRATWTDILSSLSDNVTQWSGQEAFRNFMWQKQLHLFKAPLYYIEYGIAQLGAIAVWKNYKQNPQQTLQNYFNALKLGYTHSVPHMYKTAGIAFDFSADYIQELVSFVKDQWKEL